MSRLDPLLRAVSVGLRRLPAPLLGLAAGRPRTNDRGDTLDPLVQAALTPATRFGVHFQVADVAKGRAGIRRSSQLGCRWPTEPLDMEDITLPCGLPARRYQLAEGSPRAVLVWLHGGGWVVGDLDTADSACRWLAAKAGLVVISVAYRCAPEHPFPGPVDDAEAAWRDVHAGACRSGLEHLPLGVGGDSAGGNLSAALCLRTCGTDRAPAFQVLVYPGLDLRQDTESCALFARDLALPKTTIDACLELYKPDRTHLDASPGLAEDLIGLPPAVVSTCGFDPLRDEGERHARRLAEAGVPVRALHAPTLPHGYLHMDAISPAAAAAVDELVGAIVALLDEEGVGQVQRS